MCFELTQNILLDGPHVLVDSGVLLAGLSQQLADSLNRERSRVERVQPIQQDPFHPLVVERVHIRTLRKICNRK